MYGVPVMKITPELFGVRGLAPVIHLFMNYAVEFINRAQPFRARKKFRVTVKQSPHPSKKIKVEANFFGKPGPLHLHGYFFSAYKSGAIDLPQARRRDWPLAH